MGWTALSSMLASFKDMFGPAVLLQLNLAYFLPSIPVLFLQTQYDSVLDQKIGLPRAMAARMVVGETLIRAEMDQAHQGWEQSSATTPFGPH